MSLKVLIIDDEKSVRETFSLRLSKWGYNVFQAQDGISGLEILSKGDFQVVITDLKMTGISGQEVIKQISSDFPDVSVIAITGYATVAIAVEVMKYGALDFLSKPIDFHIVRTLLGKISENISIKKENFQLKSCIVDLRSEIGQKYRFNNLVGKSQEMLAVFNLLETIAPLESTVLIYGETGTGKELVAKAIHYASPRHNGPMITIDCGVLTETLLESELFGHKKGAYTGAQSDKKGVFEQADGGTIFLDEISNASPSVQKKLLRLIQEKSFHRLGDEKIFTSNVRIVAASNEHLLKLVDEGKFRRDLFYRLNVVPIQLPPLSRRQADIPLLSRHFLDLYAKRLNRKPHDVTPDAIIQLQDHKWPGNIRELSNVIERTVILTSGDIIHKFFITEDTKDEKRTDDSNSIRLNPPLPKQIADLEYSYLRLALQHYKGRIDYVVKRSELSPRTLYRKMQLYNLNKKDFY